MNRQRNLPLIICLLFIILTGCRNVDMKILQSKYEKLQSAANETGEDYSPLIFDGPLPAPARDFVFEYGRTAVDEAAHRFLQNKYLDSPLTELFVLLTACLDDGKLSDQDRDYAKNTVRNLSNKLETVLRNRDKWRNSAVIALRLYSLFPQVESVPLVRQIVRENQKPEEYWLLLFGLGYLDQAWPLLSKEERFQIRDELQKKHKEINYERGRDTIEAYIQGMQN